MAEFHPEFATIIETMSTSLQKKQLNKNLYEDTLFAYNFSKPL